MSNAFDAFNALAWRDFVVWAWSDPSHRRAFIEATGIDIDAPRSAIEQLVDEATGNPHLHAFVRWVTENHWGLEHAPAAYRELVGSEVTHVAGISRSVNPDRSEAP
jgi:hypothetical protein